MTQAVAGALAESRPAPTNRYIAGCLYDWAFFLGAPTLGLVVAAVLGATQAAEHRFWLERGEDVGGRIALGVLVNAHLVAVLFRSHANPTIFRRHPARFLAVPAALFGLVVAFDVALVITTVVVVFWDVYHSALQTFGFARIYDRRYGNAPAAGRRLDLGLNLLLYVGPILGGATMMAHIGRVADLEEVGIDLLSTVPLFMEGHQSRIAALVIAGGLAFVGYYVVSYARLAKSGYRIAWPKVWLLASTGLCSIVAWGFNPWGLAFLIMNFLHAVQYLGLVWWSEGDRLSRLTHLKRATPFALLLMVLCYGLWAHLITPDTRWAWAVAQTIAVMHFWYDGFVWSVSRRDV